jgi:hypothetical protein
LKKANAELNKFNAFSEFDEAESKAAVVDNRSMAEVLRAKREE